MKWPVAFRNEHSRVATPVLQATQHDEPQEAVLDGLPCRATAWEDATRAPMVGREAEQKSIGGIRMWRGRAVLENVAADRLEGWYGRRVAYSGVVRIGGEARQVTADVFVSGMKRTRSAQNKWPGLLPEVHVEFVGAGNL